MVYTKLYYSYTYDANKLDEYEVKILHEFAKKARQSDKNSDAVFSYMEGINTCNLLICANSKDLIKFLEIFNSKMPLISVETVNLFPN